MRQKEFTKNGAQNIKINFWGLKSASVITILYEGCVIIYKTFRYVNKNIRTRILKTVMKNENENSVVMALRLTYQFLSDNGHLNVDQGHENRDVVPGMTLEEMFRDYNSNQLNIAFKYLVENGQVQIAKGLSDMYPQLKNLKTDSGTFFNGSDLG